jgi:hypothetical protein
MAFSPPRFRSGIVRLLIATMGLVAASATFATSVKAPAFTELVNGSDFVVRAKVTNIEYEVTHAQGGRPSVHTLVTLQVNDVIAGTPPATVVLRMLGGRTSEGELVVEGAPTFSVGDEDVLFVRGNGKSFYPLYAVMHGRYPVKRDAATGRSYVARSNGMPLADIAEVGAPLHENAATRVVQRMRSPADALSVDEFTALIRSVRGAEVGSMPVKLK